MPYDLLQGYTPRLRWSGLTVNKAAIALRQLPLIIALMNSPANAPFLGGVFRQYPDNPDLKTLSTGIFGCKDQN